MLTREFLLAFPNLIRVQKSHTHNTTAAAGERIFDERLSTIELEKWELLLHILIPAWSYRSSFAHFSLSRYLCDDDEMMRLCVVEKESVEHNKHYLLQFSCFFDCRVPKIGSSRTLCATGKTKNDIRIIKIRLSRLAFCCPFYGSIMHTQKQHTYIRVGNKVAVTIQLDCEAKSILLI